MEWQPMGQRNIPVWKVLIRVVWQSADDGIAKILAIRLRFICLFRKTFYF